MLATLAERPTVNFRPDPIQRSVQLLAFRRLGRDFAMPMSKVQELARADDIVPSAQRSRFRGVCEIGGVLIPVVDVVQSCNATIREAAAPMIVVAARSKSIGVVYDQIVQVCQVHSSRIDSALLKADAHWPRLELDHGRVAYVDPAHLVESPELTLLDSVAGMTACELVG